MKYILKDNTIIDMDELIAVAVNPNRKHIIYLFKNGARLEMRSADSVIAYEELANTLKEFPDYLKPEWYHKHRGGVK